MPILHSLSERCKKQAASLDRMGVVHMTLNLRYSTSHINKIIF